MKKLLKVAIFLKNKRSIHLHLPNQCVKSFEAICKASEEAAAQANYTQINLESLVVWIMRFIDIQQQVIAL